MLPPGLKRFPRWLEPVGRRARRARIILTAGAWPLARRLPGDSTRLGPPRHCVQSLPSWAESRPEVTLTDVDPPSSWKAALPEQPAAEIPELFRIVQDHDLHATWVARIPNGRVYGASTIVISHDDTVFGDLLDSWPKSYQYHPILSRPFLGRPKRIRGRGAVIGGLFAESYSHWLCDMVPRFRLLANEMQELDWIIVPHSHEFEQECLMRAGVPVDRLIEPWAGMHLVADELVVPSLLPRISEHTVPYLQSLFSEYRSQARPFRRLYVTRANMWRRRVSNEEELVRALASLGFEPVVMDGLSVGEQARMFSEAEVVLGPNGSALANVVFSQPGVRLVELFDSNYYHAADWEMVLRAGGHYNLMVVPSPPSTSQWRNIEVPIEKLMTLLAAHGVG